MYRPYKVAEGGHELGIIFRDHALSDLIGFHYQRSDAPCGGRRLRRQVESHRLSGPRATQPALVSVILDGENCWEHYPGGGVAFLRSLYQRCTPDTRRPPRSRGRVLTSSIRRATRCRTSSPAVGSAITSTSGSATRKTPPPGTCCTRRGEHLKRRQAQGVVAGDQVATGLEGNLHRRGERLVLVVWRRPLQRPGCPVRPPLPQALAKRVLHSRRSAAARIGQAGRRQRAAAPITRCHAHF